MSHSLTAQSGGWETATERKACCAREPPRTNTNGRNTAEHECRALDARADPHLKHVVGQVDEREGLVRVARAELRRPLADGDGDGVFLVLDRQHRA